MRFGFPVGINRVNAAVRELAIDPRSPSDVVASAGTEQQITVSWSAVADVVDLAGYKVYRAGVAGGPYTEVADVSAATTSYEDTGLTHNTVYYYVVTSYDDFGNESAKSSEVSATAVDTVAPDAPTALSATAVSATQINLSWTAPTAADVQGYKVFRSGTSGGPYTEIADVAGAASTSYSDTTAAANTTYYYVVRSYDEAANQSVNSNEATATTPLA